MAVLTTAPAALMVVARCLHALRAPIRKACSNDRRCRRGAPRKLEVHLELPNDGARCVLPVGPVHLLSEDCNPCASGAIVWWGMRFTEALLRAPVPGSGSG